MFLVRKKTKRRLLKLNKLKKIPFKLMKGILVLKGIGQSEVEISSHIENAIRF